MATTIVKTIGTGGDYSTLQAWAADCPANLVTADQIWQGQVLNQEIVFTGAAPMLSLTGITTDSTRYVELTAAPGASFIDNANVRANALRYNSANGAALRCTNAAYRLLDVRINYFRLNRLQLLNAGDAAGSFGCFDNTSATSQYCSIDKCILESYAHRTASEGGTVSIYGTGNYIANSLVVQRWNDATALVASLNTATAAYNCTFVNVGALGTGTGIRGVYGSVTLRNCFVGNVGTVTTGTSTFNKTTCRTSVAGPPAGWSAAPYDTATFVSVSTDGTHDYRLAEGSALIDVGTTDSTYAANDITGLARSGTWDVGVWEYMASGTGATFTITTADATFSGSGQVSPIASFALTASAVTVSGSASSGMSDATFAINTATTIFSGAAAGNTSNGVLTTPALKNNTGTLLANETGIAAYIYTPSTGALVVSKTGQTTNASGVMTITDALIVAGTQYRVVIVLGSGAEGMDKLTAT